VGERYLGGETYMLVWGGDADGIRNDKGSHLLIDRLDIGER